MSRPPSPPGHRLNPHVAAAGRLDVSHDGQHVTIVLETPDGTWIERPLTLPEAAALIKRLAGYLQQHIGATP